MTELLNVWIRKEVHNDVSNYESFICLFKIQFASCADVLYCEQTFYIVHDSDSTVEILSLLFLSIYESYWNLNCILFLLAIALGNSKYINEISEKVRDVANEVAYIRNTLLYLMKEDLRKAFRSDM